MTKNYHNSKNSYIKLSLQILSVVLIFMSSSLAHAFDLTHYCDTSRLAKGKWVKVAVSESGIYQITASDASKWGFSDLSRVRVFGYGGKQLSDTLRANQFDDDLPQAGRNLYGP